MRGIWSGRGACAVTWESEKLQTEFEFARGAPRVRPQLTRERRRSVRPHAARRKTSSRLQSAPQVPATGGRDALRTTSDTGVWGGRAEATARNLRSADVPGLPIPDRAQGGYLRPPTRDSPLSDCYQSWREPVWARHFRGVNTLQNAKIPKWSATVTFTQSWPPRRAGCVSPGPGLCPLCWLLLWWPCQQATACCSPSRAGGRLGSWTRLSFRTLSWFWHHLGPYAGPASPRGFSEGRPVGQRPPRWLLHPLPAQRQMCTPPTCVCGDVQKYTNTQLSLLKFSSLFIFWSTGKVYQHLFLWSRLNFMNNFTTFHFPSLHVFTLSLHVFPSMELWEPLPVLRSRWARRR